MHKEGEAGYFIIDAKKVRERVAAACGVSMSTLARIGREKRKNELLSDATSAPPKKRLKTRPVTGLDDFDIAVVRRIVNDFHRTEKCLPTQRNICAKLIRETNFSGSCSSVCRILKRIGFRWKKTRTNKKVLMESPEISYKRFVFLKKIDQYRKEGRPIVYTDESYIDSSHVSGKGWSDASESGVAAPVSKGERLIFLNAGGEMGVIPNCLTMWKASKTTGDYHNNVNNAIYVKWLREKLIPNLPPKSVIVIDNASYHNKRIDECPTSNTVKAKIQSWLSEKKIDYSPSMSKAELYELVKKHKPSNVRYIIDDILKSHEHDILRLPPYHPELNAIELIWADVKNWVAAHNVTFKFNEVERLTQQRFDMLTKDDWIKKCKNAQKFEKNFLSSQAPLDDAVDSFIINLGIESSEDEDSDLESTDECENESENEITVSNGSMSGVA